jgi:polyisoprenoid-binding protein YceI
MGKDNKINCIVALAVYTLVWIGHASSTHAENHCFALDPTHTPTGFLVDHVGYAKTFGQFKDVEGSFCFDEQTLTLSDVRVLANADSIETLNRARDIHLSSGDFLNTDEYSQIEFNGLSSTQTGERTGPVRGNITLLGQTRPLTLDVTWNKSGAYPFGDKHYAMGASATGSLNRSDFGMSKCLANSR